MDDNKVALESFSMTLVDTLGGPEIYFDSSNPLSREGTYIPLELFEKMAAKLGWLSPEMVEEITDVITVLRSELDSYIKEIYGAQYGAQIS